VPVANVSVQTRRSMVLSDLSSSMQNSSALSGDSAGGGGEPSLSNGNDLTMMQNSSSDKSRTSKICDDLRE